MSAKHIVSKICIRTIDFALVALRTDFAVQVGDAFFPVQLDIDSFLVVTVEARKGCFWAQCELRPKFRRQTTDQGAPSCGSG